jgi:hypothetical protein
MAQQAGDPRRDPARESELWPVRLLPAFLRDVSAANLHRRLICFSYSIGHFLRERYALMTDTVRIPLGQNGTFAATVDAESFEAETELVLRDGTRWEGRICDLKWSLNSRPTNRYARASAKIDGKYRHFMLHRAVLSPRPGQLVDHINHDGLDNRLCNLRIVSDAENSRNRRPREGRRFKGVHFWKKNRKWGASIRLNGKTKFLGFHESEEAAALAYNAAAAKRYGDLAYLNEVPAAQAMADQWGGLA